MDWIRGCRASDDCLGPDVFAYVTCRSVPADTVHSFIALYHVRRMLHFFQQQLRTPLACSGYVLPYIGFLFASVSIEEFRMIND